MPLYEYRCRGCGRRFERIQKVSDEPVRECPYCGEPVDRLLGIPALQFKGSGWYVTDYGRGNGGSGRTRRNGSPSEANGSEKPKKDSGETTAGDKSSAAEKASS